MATIGEEIKTWEREYMEGDAVHRYVMHTLLLLQSFKVEQELLFLKTHPDLEVTREQFEKALSQ